MPMIFFFSASIFLAGSINKAAVLASLDSGGLASLSNEQRALNGKAALINIKEGLVSNDSTEVFGNLKANDKILIHASDEIRQGDQIQ